MKKLVSLPLFVAVAATLSADSSREPQKPHWEWCGWGGGGYFWSAAADPKDPDVFYLGGDVVGLYKSTDGGRSWSFANNGLHNYGVYSLAVAPSDGRTLYAMTEDGIARSRDAAESWTPLAESRNGARKLSIKRGATVRGVAVDPTNPLVVYAGSARGEVCKSTDGGDTWTKLDFLSALPKEAPQGPDASSGESFLWFGVNFPQGDWNAHARLERFLSQSGADWSAYRALAAKVYLPKGNVKLSASIAVQSGSGWSWVESPFKNLVPGEWNDVELDFSKVTDPASCKLVHLLIRRQQNEAFKGEVGIDAVRLLPKDPAAKPQVIGDWETKDLDGWRKSNANDARFSGATRSSRSAAEPDDGPIASVVVSPTNPRLLFVAHSTLGLFRSADGGASWTFAGALPRKARHVAGGANLFYAAFGSTSSSRKDGLFRSDDAGVTWTPVEGLPAGASVREIAIDPRNPKTIHLIATSGWNGQYIVSRDGGATWKSNRRFERDLVGNPTLAGQGKNGDLSAATNLAMSPADPDRLVISANWNNLVSHDGGLSWQEASKGADITCFHDLRFAGNSVYAAAMDEGLFRSDDNGATWKNLTPQRYTPGLSGHQWRVLPQILPGGRVRILSTVSAWRAERDYPPSVLLSEDNGATFTRSTGLPEYRSHTNCMWGEAHARAIAADPSNPDIIYLGIDGDPENGNAGEGVFKSTDGGKTFTQLAAQPGSRRMFYGIAVDPTDPKRVFWAACGATSGVYVSPDAGASWRKTSCPTEWFFNLEVTPSGTVLAGGNHLWISRDHGETWTQSTKIEGVTICGIAFDPADENRLWVGATTWGSGDTPGVGVYESTDGGRTWTNISGDIPNRKPLIVRYNPATRELWAAGPGVFRTRR